MDEIHRKVLQRNRPYLMKEVMLEMLWPHLVAREIFTDEMIEHIQVREVGLVLGLAIAPN